MLEWVAQFICKGATFVAINQVLMPPMGEGVNEGTVIKWHKKQGDKVSKGEPLLEISTDKVDTEIPSPTDGFVIQLLASEGSTIEVNQLIAVIADDKNAKFDAPANVASAKKAATPQPSAAPRAAAPQTARSVTVSSDASKSEMLQKSSPLVRKMASEHGVDLRYVGGSGLNGKITKDDFYRFLQSGGMAAVQLQAPEQPLLARVETKKDGNVETLDGVPVRREKMQKMRRLIAEHMVESVRTSPHVTTVFEIDMKNVWDAREKMKSTFEKKYGFKLTFTPFMIYAAIQSIKEHPITNVSVDGDEVLFKDDINVGCAVALGDGLIVPVIKKSNNLSLVEVAQRLNDLVTKARDKKLSPSDVVGGTFSITNPGGFGSILSNPIINQPQVAMLCIGAIVKRPMVIDDKIEIRPHMYAGLTFDHRVIDGEGGAKYLATFKSILEKTDWKI